MSVHSAGTVGQGVLVSVALWLSSAFAVGPVPDLGCATLRMLEGAPPVRRDPAWIGPPPPLVVRDPFDVPNERTSEHFALHWGNQGGITDADVDLLLDALELAWEVQVDQYAHPAPATTDAYYFNAYIGDTGSGAPGGYGAGGYYTVDAQGFPYVVIALASLSYYGGAFGEHAAIHEFYHAIQGSTERYDYDFDGLSAWYWEATAEWSTIEVDPADPFNGTFVWSYLMTPQLPAQFFDYPDTGALVEYRQYGAFLLPHYLTERFGYAVVRDSWSVPGSEEDPLEVLRDQLAVLGEDLDEHWLDHAAHNATFDYAAGGTYSYLVSAYESAFPSQRIADHLAGAGGEGEIRGASAPYRYGYVQVQLEDPIEGTLTATVTGDPTGTEGTEALWGARVAVEHADTTVDYHPLPFVGSGGEVVVEGIVSTDEIWLVVGAWSASDATWHTEQYEFEWSLGVEEVEETEPPTTGPTGDDDDDDVDFTPDPEDEAEEPAAEPAGGCGCGSAAPAGLLPVLAAAMLARRRRRA